MVYRPPEDYFISEKLCIVPLRMPGIQVMSLRCPSKIERAYIAFFGLFFPYPCEKE